jgi:hypothetical protein
MATLPATITPAMARRIEIWRTDRLVPYARNARTQSAEQVAQVAASIDEFGWTNPILASADGVTIAGHLQFPPSASQMVGHELLQEWRRCPRTAA